MPGAKLENLLTVWLPLWDRPTWTPPLCRNL